MIFKNTGTKFKRKKKEKEEERMRKERRGGRGRERPCGRKPACRLDPVTAEWWQLVLRHGGRAFARIMLHHSGEAHLHPLKHSRKQRGVVHQESLYPSGKPVLNLIWVSSPFESLIKTGDFLQENANVTHSYAQTEAWHIIS